MTRVLHLIDDDAGTGTPMTLRLSLDASAAARGDEAERHAAFNLRYELYVVEQGLFADQADHERRELSDAVDAHATQDSTASSSFSEKYQ